MLADLIATLQEVFLEKGDESIDFYGKRYSFQTVPKKLVPALK